MFLCLYAANFAVNIKTPQISELCEFCREYRSIANVPTVFDAEFKRPQILKCHRFQSAANVSFYSYFYLLLS